MNTPSCGGASIGMLSSGAAPANAVSEFHRQLPINAGTRLRLPVEYCTSGAVLSSRNWYPHLSARSKANRYVVTAGH